MNIKIVNLLFILVLFPNFVSAEWKIIDSLTHPEFNSFRFNDIKSYNFKDILILVDVNWDLPYIYKSNDSGYTWSVKLFSQKVIRTNEFVYPNRNLAIFMCDSGYYFRSTNNGETWVEHRFDNQRRSWKLGFWDDKIGIVFQSKFGEKVIYQKTTDGGLSWYELSGPNLKLKETSSYIVTKGQGICYFIEIDNIKDSVYYFHKSTDYGETWQEPYPGPKIPPYGDFYFYDENLGFCFGGEPFGNEGRERKIIRRTSDGGRTWTKVLDTNLVPEIRIFYMHFRDSLNGIATALRSVFRTNDGGITWYRDLSFGDEYIGKGIDQVVLLDSNNAVGLSNFPFEYIYRYKSNKNTSVLDKVIYQELNIFPNPAKSIINIDLEDALIADTEYSIFDNQGKVVKQGVLNQSIDVEELIIGTYYLLISEGDNIYYSKFVKE